MMMTNNFTIGAKKFINLFAILFCIIPSLNYGLFVSIVRLNSEYRFAKSETSTSATVSN